MKFSAGLKTSGGGSGTTPMASIYGSASGGGRLREIGIFNTTSTPFAVFLRRLTSAGTPGTGQTEEPHDEANAPNANCAVVDTHSADPTLKSGNLGYRMRIGAAVGAGGIFTFGDEGIVIPKDAAKGIGILIADGTGQICDVYFVWDE